MESYEALSLRKEADEIDSEIDNIVFHLYGLTKDDICFVNAGMGIVEKGELS